MRPLFIISALILGCCCAGHAQIILTVAGNGSAAYGGDSGPATAASFNPVGIAFDTLSNLYIGDEANNRIRIVNNDGIINTFAGTGTPGFSGDGFAATAAELNLPGSPFPDRAGNIYFGSSYRVRTVDYAGIIATVAGNGTFGYTGDGLPATDAEIQGTVEIIDTLGNKYLSGLNVIRVINESGIISTVAGNGLPAHSVAMEVRPVSPSLKETPACAVTTRVIYM